MMGKLLLIIIVIVLVASLFRNTGPTPPLATTSSRTEQAPAAVPSEPEWNPTEEEVAARKKLIRDLQQKRIFGKLRVANRVGRVTAGSKFQSIDFETKQSFASVAFAWCLDIDPNCVILVIHDPGTNKEIGEFSRTHGGLKMH